MRAAQMLSLPKRVRNQGAPAARNASPGSPGSASRSERRSSSDWSSSLVTRRSPAVTCGGLHSRVALGGTTTAVGSSTANSQRRVARPRGGRLTSHRRRAPSPAVAWAPWPVTVTRVVSACQVRRPSPASPAGTGVPERPDLTASTAAKSHASSTVTVAVTGDDAVETISTCSPMPNGDSSRERSIRTVGSVVGSPSQRVRDTNRACPAAPGAYPMDSGSRPSTRSRAWESTRRSAQKSPCTPAGRIWPSASLSALAGAMTVLTRSCSSG